MSSLASRLIGKKIGKWKVIKKRIKDDNDDSGFASSCYIVEDENGKVAFLKAYNYFYAFGSKAGSADALKYMTKNFTYERDLLNFCNEHNMRRIVRALESGEYLEPGEVIPVPYLIFEMANGSLKTDCINKPDLSWKLITFHGALVGLEQLHYAKIAHQDLKPSNILIFGENHAKIADLGSSTQLNNKSNWEQELHAGDMRYAPIELLYSYCSSNWDTRRFGADLFMLGGILTFILTNNNFISLMLSKIPASHHFMNFGGTFEEVKPYLLKSYNETISDIENFIPKELFPDLSTMLQELNHPIPEERGNPIKFHKVHKRYSLKRYISMTDRLSKIAYRNNL